MFIKDKNKNGISNSIEGVLYLKFMTARYKHDEEKKQEKKG